MTESPDSSKQEISFLALRQRGFRIMECWGNYQLHMRIEIDRRLDTWLEIGPLGKGKDVEWSCWIVSEMSHRYSKMCYLRSMRTMDRVELLYMALTDQPLGFDEAVNLESFTNALETCGRRAQEHFSQQYTNVEVCKHLLQPRH